MVQALTRAVAQEHVGVVLVGSRRQFAPFGATLPDYFFLGQGLTPVELFTQHGTLLGSFMNVIGTPERLRAFLATQRAV